MCGYRRGYDALESLVANSGEKTHSSAAPPLLRHMLQVQWGPMDSAAQGQRHTSPRAQQCVRVRKYHRSGRPRGDRIRSSEETGQVGEDIFITTRCTRTSGWAISSALPSKNGLKSCFEYKRSPVAIGVETERARSANSDGNVGRRGSASTMAQ